MLFELETIQEYRRVYEDFIQSFVDEFKQGILEGEYASQEHVRQSIPECLENSTWMDTQYHWPALSIVALICGSHPCAGLVEVDKWDPIDPFPFRQLAKAAIQADAIHRLTNHQILRDLPYKLAYRVVLRDCGFEIYAVEPPVVQVREFDVRREKEKVTQRTYRDVLGVDPPPLFWCIWVSKDQEWLCDIDCGAQRQRGRRTDEEIREALRRCEFPQSYIEYLLDRSKNGKKVEESAANSERDDPATTSDV